MVIFRNFQYWPNFASADCAKFLLKIYGFGRFILGHCKIGFKLLSWP